MRSADVSTVTMPSLTDSRHRRRHAVVFSSRLMDIGSATDRGRVREGNEDALLVMYPEGARKGQILVAVADGMGGHKAGEVASDLAVRGLERALQEAEPTTPAGPTLG